MSGILYDAVDESTGEPIWELAAEYVPVARPRVRRREYLRAFPFFSRAIDSKDSSTC